MACEALSDPAFHATLTHLIISLLPSSWILPVPQHIKHPLLSGPLYLLFLLPRKLLPCTFMVHSINDFPIYLNVISSKMSSPIIICKTAPYHPLSPFHSLIFLITYHHLTHYIFVFFQCLLPNFPPLKCEIHKGQLCCCCFLSPPEQCLVHRRPQ